MTRHAAATRLPRAYRVLVLLLLDWLMQSADAIGCRASSIGRAFCAVNLLGSRLLRSTVAIGCPGSADALSAQWADALSGLVGSLACWAFWAARLSGQQADARRWPVTDTI